MDRKSILRLAFRLVESALSKEQKERVDPFTESRAKNLSFGLFKNTHTWIRIGSVELDDIESDEEIANILEESGYVIDNYRKGMVYSKSDKSKRRQIRLIKALRRAVKDDDEFNRLKKVFDHRLGTGRKEVEDLSIVISHDPYDVAGMSTNRNWTSCNDIGYSDRKDVFKEVKNGGMVAYLTKTGDKEIEEPIARVSIKRFNGLDGFIFLAEEVIYGDFDLAEDVNMLDLINKKLEESNKVTGGSFGTFHSRDLYSDTFSSLSYSYEDSKRNTENFEARVHEAVKERGFEVYPILNMLVLDKDRYFKGGLTNSAYLKGMNKDDLKGYISDKTFDFMQKDISSRGVKQGDFASLIAVYGDFPFLSDVKQLERYYLKDPLANFDIFSEIDILKTPWDVSSKNKYERDVVKLFLRIILLTVEDKKNFEMFPSNDALFSRKLKEIILNSESFNEGYIARLIQGAVENNFYREDVARVEITAEHKKAINAIINGINKNPSVYIDTFIHEYTLIDIIINDNRTKPEVLKQFYERLKEADGIMKTLLEENKEDERYEKHYLYCIQEIGRLRGVIEDLLQ